MWSIGGRCLKIVGGWTDRVTLIGVIRDISDQEAARAGRELLMKELRHRIRNLFAVAVTVVNRTLAGRPGHADASSQVTDQLLTLSRAHVAAFGEGCDVADLRETLAAVLDPSKDRIALDVERVPLKPEDTSALALFFHERRRTG